jgi:hypothetical protein
MIGVVGALVALAALLALVLVLIVRPHARRLARTVADLRADTVVRLDRLRAIRRARPGRSRPHDATPVLRGPSRSDAAA